MSVVASNGVSAAEKNEAGALALATTRVSSDTLYTLGAGLGCFVTMSFLTALAATWKKGVPLPVSIGLLVATSIAAAVLTTFATHALSLRRYTGMFVIDPRDRSITHRGGERYSFDDVVDVRASSRFAGQLRGQPNIGWWLLVDTKGGATLRVYRGSWGEIRTIAAELGAMGLPLDGDLREEEGVLLRTSACLVRRDDRGRLVLENTMRGTKIFSPFLLVVWLVLTASYVRAGLAGSSVAWVFVAVLVAGTAYGFFNLMRTHRWSGIFTIDAEARTVTRAPSQALPFGQLDGVQLGTVSFRGVSPGPLGPTVVAAVRESDDAMWLLFGGAPGDVRFVGELIAAEGLSVREVGETAPSGSGGAALPSADEPLAQPSPSSSVGAGASGVGARRSTSIFSMSSGSGSSKRTSSSVCGCTNPSSAACSMMRGASMRAPLYRRM